MKWLALFKKKRSKLDEEGEGAPTDGDEDDIDVDSPKKRGGRGSRPAAERRPSLDVWFEARRARISSDVNNATTTEQLQVCKAGVTMLINRTYIVIKHLGTGTYGQVKLAFNLNDKKLYAIKTCKKSQLGCPVSVGSKHRQGQARQGLFRLRRSYNGGDGGSGPPRFGRGPMFQAAPGTSLGPPLSSSSQPASQGTWSLPSSSCSDSLQSGGRAGYSVTCPCSTSTSSHQQQQQEEGSSGGAAAPAAQPTPPVATPSSSAGSSGLLKVKDMLAAVKEVAQQQQQQQQRRQFGAGGGGGGGGCGSLPPGLGMPPVPAAFEQMRAEEFVREIAILKKLAHDNIVKLVEVIDDPSSDNLLLVMEYVEGAALQPRKLSSNRWEQETEMVVWGWIRDILQGLEYLHYHNVVHGDLKPANFIMDSNTRSVKIVDFGSSVLSQRPGGVHPSGLGMIISAGTMGPGTMACTPAFRSPESLQPGYHLSFEMDMWALGVSVFMWVFGELPFTGSAPFLVYESIKRQELKIPTHTRISAELTQFLGALLEKDPSQRLDVWSALQQPWVTGRGTAPLTLSRALYEDDVLDEGEEEEEGARGEEGMGEVMEHSGGAAECSGSGGQGGVSQEGEGGGEGGGGAGVSAVLCGGGEESVPTD